MALSKYHFFIDEFQDHGLIESVFTKNIESYLDVATRYFKQNSRNKTKLKLACWTSYYGSARSKEDIGSFLYIDRTTVHHHIDSVNYVLRHLPEFSDMWGK